MNGDPVSGHPEPAGTPPSGKAGTPRRAHVRNALKMVIGVGILAWLFTKIPIREVGQTLRTANPMWLATACVLFLVSLVVLARRTRYITRHQGLTLNTMALLRITAAVSFYNMAMPGGIGGSVIRWHKMSRKDAKPAQAFNAMMYDRVITHLVLLLVGGIFLAVDWPFGRHPLAWPAALALAITGAVYLATYALMFNGRVSAWVDLRVAPRMPGRIREALRRIATSTDRFAELSPRVKWKIWGWSLLGRAFNLMVYYSLVLALDLPLSFAAIAWVRTVVYCAVLLPVSFSGLGVREGVTVALLTPYGVAPESALALSMLVFSFILIHAFMGGMFEIFDGMQGASRRKDAQR